MSGSITDGSWASATATNGAPVIAVLDTDSGVRWAVEQGLARDGYVVHSVGSTSDVISLAQRESIDVYILEILPEAGLTSELLTMLRNTPQPPDIICVSIDADPQMVVDCIRRGASDFLPKPFSLAELRASLQKVLTASQGRRERRTAPSPLLAGENASPIIGISLAMQELRKTIRQVAATDLNCLIRGESGTGKDMVAREIHRLSARSAKPFLKVNCTALPEQLLESELFGYEKGAFTGAVTSKPGRFELAHGGIIFLDEIGDMHPNLQSKLLQVIEHKEFTKLGGRKSFNVDVQIIAATNADLEDKTHRGEFREDLFFRLNEVSIWVPSLAERSEDIPLLVRYFVQKHGRFAGTDTQFSITGEDLEALIAHDWPGNVRELESTIKRWLALGQKVLPYRQASGSTAHRMNSPALGRRQPSSSSKPKQVSRGAGTMSEDEEKALLTRTLEECLWNRRKAAERLGLSYQALRRRISVLGLNQPQE